MTHSVPVDPATGSEGSFDAGNVVLQSGRTFRNMRLVYKTFGTLNADKSNAIL